MGVDHRGLHAPVAEELLHRPNIVAIHQQVRGERQDSRLSLPEIGLADA